ncbi:GGDEF domain-containing protein [Aestuariibius insulae]|uniref:GGDEF domain-containing protein n=1 Tax=Aestuariibius insulae TaxID=2058287 RepID=UPI00345EC998
MLNRIFNLLAVHSLSEGVLKGTLIMMLAIVLHFAVDYGLDGHLWMPPVDLALTTVLVGSPFLVLMLTALAHFKRLELRFFNLSRTDPLTGLPNRQAFFDEAANRLEQARGGAVLLVDVDHFKQINDTYGHSTGDHCLTVVADHLRAMTRADDLVARIGGEEFAFYFPALSAQAMHSIEERLCKTLDIQLADMMDPIKITVSAGAVMVASGQEIETLLARADEALYRAKRSGRARLRMWSDCQNDPRQHGVLTVNSAA